MTSPARRHFMQQSALAAASGAADPAQLTVYQRLLKQLHADKMVLKSIKGDADKAAAKADMLPAYADWVQGTMQGEPRENDQITPTILVWMIDCGLLDQTLPLAEFALTHNLPSADEYQRDMPEIIIEQYAEQIAAGHTVDSDTVKQLIEWATEKTDNGQHRYNMHDNIRAKLLKAAGEWAEEQDARDWARSLYEKALAYNEKCGVKKRIAALS